MGVSVPKPKMKRLVCNACDLNHLCNFYRNHSFRFSVGDVSTHVIPIDAGYEERAFYCCHRDKIDIKEVLKNVQTEVSEGAVERVD
jgi:hypothetical protein